MTRLRSGLAIAGLVAVAGTTISLLAFPALPRQGDSFQYLISAHWVLGSAEFTGGNHPVGYPVFLAALLRMGGTAFGPLLLVAQHAIRLLALVLFGWLAVRYPRRPAVGAAAVLWAAAPEGLVFSHFVMAEAVATGLAGVAAVAILRHADRPSERRAAAAGGAIAVLTLFKSAGAVWLIPLLAIAPTSRRSSRLRFAGMVLVGFIAVSAGAAGWVRARTGTWVPPGAPGEHLFSRIVSEGGALPAGDPGLADLNARVALPRSAPAAQAWEYARTLEALGVAPAARDRLFLGLAVRGLVRSPVRYIVGTVRGAVELAVWVPVAPAGASAYRVREHRLVVPATPTGALGEVARFVPDAEAVAWMLRLLGAAFDDGVAGGWLAAWTAGWRSTMWILRWPLVLAMCCGAWALRRDRTVGAAGRMAGVLAGSWLLAHAAAEMPVPRFGLPIQPLLMWLACEGVMAARRSFAKMTGVR